MKKKLGNDLLLLNISVIAYALYISFCIFKHKAALADDLSKIYESGNISQPYFKFIYSFLDSHTMAARPVSGFMTGTLMFLSGYSESVYWLGLFFFPLSLLVMYRVAQKIASPQWAGLLALLYSCSVIGTSIQFSPIMLNSNLATLFFCLSIYCLYVRKNIWGSSLLFIASVFSYEIFLPLVLLHLFFIKENKKRAIFMILTVGFIIIFRKIIQPAVFENSYQRDEISKIFDVERILHIFIYAVKLFCKDVFVGVYKGVLNLKKLNLYEWMAVLIIPSLVYKVFSGYDFKTDIRRFKNLGIISFTGILLGMSIFLFSSYRPTLFGFDNRNLGAVRLFYTLFIISAVIFLGIKLNFKSKIIASLLGFVAFLFLATNISAKNSWIYANHFNHKMFGKLRTALKQNNITHGDICLDYNMSAEVKTNPGFTFREPVFYNTWEAPMLCKMNGIDPEKIHVYNMERKSDCKIIFLYKKGKMIRSK